MSQQTSPKLNETKTGSLWTLRDVTLPSRGMPRLDRVSLTLPASRVALLGVSGAGKSSLLGLLAGFETAKCGEVAAHDFSPLPSLPVFWSPQDYGLWPHLTVREHLEHVRPAASRTGLSITEWLQRFRMDGLVDSRPDALSEGEQSRLSVVRALTSEADVLLLDEPLAHVDPVHREDDWRTVMGHAEKFCRGVVFSTHEPAIVRRFAEYVVCLDRGRIQFAGPTNQLLYSPPDRISAWLLGPCNWIDEKNRHWFSDANPAWTCLRPEETLIVSDPAGALLVVGIEDHGSGIQFDLHDSESDSKIVVNVTRNPEVQVNSRVRLNVIPSTNRK